MTKREIMNEIFSELHQKRTNEIFLAEQNEQLAKQNDEYRELDTKERNLKMQIGKLQFEQKPYLTEQAQLVAVKEQKQKLLKKLGFEPNDLLPKFECQKCNDTGVIGNSICSCANQKFYDKLMKLSNVNLDEIPYLKDYDYKFFEEKEEQIFAEKCVKTLTDYVRDFDSLKKKNIVMCGGSGTGKTYLTKCIAKELISKSKSTYFISSFDLNNLFLRDHLNQNGEKQLNDLIDLDVLIIDDLGTEPIRKNVTKEYLLVLLNERLAKGKSTIITTNLSMDDALELYEERIFSRIFDKRSTLIMQFQGKNNRLKM